MASTGSHPLKDPAVWAEIAARIASPYSYDLADDSHAMDVAQIVCEAIAELGLGDTSRLQSELDEVRAELAEWTYRIDCPPREIEPYCGIRIFEPGPETTIWVTTPHGSLLAKVPTKDVQWGGPG